MKQIINLVDDMNCKDNGYKPFRVLMVIIAFIVVTIAVLINQHLICLLDYLIAYLMGVAIKYSKYQIFGLNEIY